MLPKRIDCGHIEPSGEKWLKNGHLAAQAREPISAIQSYESGSHPFRRRGGPYEHGGL
jgi:hypothetical protein